jgi:hypothetical protein
VTLFLMGACAGAIATVFVMAALVWWFTRERG